MNQQKISALPSIRRLPHYLRVLKELKKNGETMVSGTYLSEQLHCEPIQVRKDIALTGTEGRPRLGFDIQSTVDAIEEFLGWNNPRDAFLIGVGSLGAALLGYKAFEQHNLNIIAAFDNSLEKVGSIVHGKEVFDLKRLPDLVNRLHVQIGILTVPAYAAQAVATFLAECGISGIWNFTPVKLILPSEIIVQNEDLSSGLAVLCRHLQTRQRNIPESEGCENGRENE
ncbi:MAG TPA: redox-sensing transcriptional repressor Rex [Chitinispirillaceae bacterium]|nr:redox-sensing transcriptional repressor Rex [Chitinispirillaceae bacterium]